MALSNIFARPRTGSPIKGGRTVTMPSFMPMAERQKDRSRSSKFKATPIKRTGLAPNSLEHLAALTTCDGSLNSQTVSKQSFTLRFGSTISARTHLLWIAIKGHAPSFHPMLAMC